MVQLNCELYRDRIHRNYLLMDYIDHLRNQEKILEFLKEIPQLIKEKKQSSILTNKNLITSLMFTMYQNACTKQLFEKA